MVSNEITIKFDNDGLQEAVEQMERFVGLLRETQETLNSISKSELASPERTKRSMDFLQGVRELADLLSSTKNRNP